MTFSHGFKHGQISGGCRCDRAVWRTCGGFCRAAGGFSCCYRHGCRDRLKLPQRCRRDRLPLPGCRMLPIFSRRLLCADHIYIFENIRRRSEKPIFKNETPGAKKQVTGINSGQVMSIYGHIQNATIYILICTIYILMLHIDLTPSICQY